jgi:glycosyltransferase involved in cell wall biosynthesis
MADRTRVLWVMKGLGRGGAERLTTSCAREIDHDRYELEVAYVLPWKDAFVPELARDGVRVHCLGEDGVRAAWVRALHRLLRRERYDLVHTHSPVPAVAARLMPRFLVPALVHTEHNVWQRYRLPTYAANALTYGRNDAAIAVSRGVADSVAAPRWAPWLRPVKPEVLHHGIDFASVRSGPAAREAARVALGLPLDAPVLGSVANFTPKKDQMTLLAAARRLVDDRPDLVLLLIGSGPLQDQLEQRARVLGLERNVRFLGSRDDVPDLLPAMDVFVLSSLHEGLSIALVEAMAAGVPPVATAVGGVPELVQHGVSGLLVPTGDATALADSVAGLLDDADARGSLVQGAVARAAAFGIGPAAHHLEALYAEVLAR